MNGATGRASADFGPSETMDWSASAAAGFAALAHPRQLSHLAIAAQSRPASINVVAAPLSPCVSRLEIQAGDRAPRFYFRWQLSYLAIAAQAGLPAENWSLPRCRRRCNLWGFSTRSRAAILFQVAIELPRHRCASRIARWPVVAASLSPSHQRFGVQHGIARRDSISGGNRATSLSLRKQDCPRRAGRCPAVAVGATFGVSARDRAPQFYFRWQLSHLAIAAQAGLATETAKPQYKPTSTVVSIDIGFRSRQNVGPQVRRTSRVLCFEKHRSNKTLKLTGLRPAAYRQGVRPK